MFVNGHPRITPGTGIFDPVDLAHSPVMYDV